MLKLKSEISLNFHNYQMHSNKSKFKIFCFLLFSPNLFSVKFYSLSLSDFSQKFKYLCHIHIILGEGKGNPLQYSCLENPMDGGSW